MKIESASDAPRTSGLYALFFDDKKIVKIGRTKNLRSRLLSHIQNTQPWGISLELHIFECTDIVSQERSILERARDSMEPIANEHFKYTDKAHTLNLFSSVDTKEQQRENIKYDLVCKVVWRYIKKRVSEGNPSILYKDLSEVASCSEAKVKRALDKLLLGGYIHREVVKIKGFSKSYLYSLPPCSEV